MTVEMTHPEKMIEFENYLNEIRSQILPYDNNELENEWIGLISVFQEMKQKGSNFEDSLVKWGKQKERFFSKWNALEKAGKNDIEMNAPKADKLLVDGGNGLSYLLLRYEDPDAVGSDARNYQNFSYWLYSKTELEHPSGDELNRAYLQSLKNEYDQLAKKFSKNRLKSIEEVGKKNILTHHNILTEKKLDNIFSVEELRQNSRAYIQLFSLIEPNFNKKGFLKFLEKNDFFSDASMSHYQTLKKAEGIDIDLGMMLREQYQKYTPFQNRKPIFDKEIIDKLQADNLDLWQKLRIKQRECFDLDCYNKRASWGLFEIFRGRYYKQAFSCLGNNPLVLKSLVMDIGIVWGGLAYLYSRDTEEYQRFPYEMMISGAVFAPVMAEANCRASFKGNLSFGTQLPEKEVFANVITKTKRLSGHFSSIATRGFLASMGMLSMTAGIDHILLGLGHSIATPIAMNDILTLIPAAFLYHGAWYGVKSLGIMNPIRHKIVPKLAEVLSRKLRVKKAYWPLQTGLDFGVYHAFSTLGRWDYLIFYSAVLYPFTKEFFTVGNDLEHKEELIKEDIIEHTYTGTSDAGVETEVVLIEDRTSPAEADAIPMEGASSKGSIQLKSVDIDVPDKVIDDWATKILEGLPQN